MLGVDEWAAFTLGLFVYALVLNGIRYGPAGPALWLRAKFLNQTTGANTPTPRTQPVGPG